MVAWRSTFHRTSWSSTPIATPATNAPDSDVMPVTTAAASAGSRTVGPDVTSSAMPSLGTRIVTVRAARPPAIDHSSIDRRLTGMPSSRARSMLSAMPRTAMPASVRSRNQVSAASTTGTTARSARSLPLNSTGSNSNLWRLSGVLSELTIGWPPSRSGRKIAAPPRAWARPTVATVSTRRGAVANRRMTKRSTSAPIATPTATPTGPAMTHDQPLPSARPAATPAPALPMAP